MEKRFSSLKCREVVNICDGARLGFVSDVEVDLKTGRITAIVVPGPCRFLGVAGRRDDYVIPWQCIQRIGDDIILIEAELEKTRIPRAKKNIF